MEMENHNVEMSGTNIVGILPGKKFGTKEDRVLVVGAHWDTVKVSPGFNDNGSGVAALIELARAFAQAECEQEYTLILVALDLEEYGTQGALAFVQDILIDRIMHPSGFPEFQVYLMFYLSLYKNN